MGSVWLKNMLGYGSFGKSETWESEIKTIPYPTLELTIHVTTKTVQIGSLLGGITSLIASRFAKVPGQQYRFGAFGVLIGLAAGPAMTYSRLRSTKSTQMEIYDRCYRLRHNNNQLNIDRATYLAAMAGAIVKGGLQGASVGINIAVGACILYAFAIKFMVDDKSKKTTDQ